MAVPLPLGFDPLTLALTGGLKAAGMIFGGGDEPQERKPFMLSPEAGGGSIAANIAQFLNDHLAAELGNAQERRGKIEPFKLDLPSSSPASTALAPVSRGIQNVGSKLTGGSPGFVGPGGFGSGSGASSLVTPPTSVVDAGQPHEQTRSAVMALVHQLLTEGRLT